jgi:outer membrane protein assembly factor BamC
MKILCAAIAGVALLSLVGCSALTGDERIDYGAGAKRVPTLEVPPDLTIPGADDRYKVPEMAANYSDYVRGGVQSKTGTAVLPELQKVRLERNGTQRYLVVKDEPENVWVTIKAFWQEIGLTIKNEDQAAGVMETDWAENRARIPQGAVRKMLGRVFNNVYSSGERDQYLTRLERGKDGASTEIYVSYRGKIEVFNADKTASKWQDRPVDTEVEAIMLQRLMVRLGATELQAKNATRTAPDDAAVVPPQPDGTAVLRETSGGESVILMGDTFDRAWRRVGLAIERSSLRLSDKDREKGIYFLQLPEVKKGFVEKLKFWDDQADANKLYQVNVRSGGETCEVSVAAQDGAKNKTSKQILELIYKNIEPK